VAESRHDESKENYDRGGSKEHMSRKLVRDEQRAIVLAALLPGSNKSEIARRYGISRSRIYQLLEIAATNPRERLKDAEKEAHYWREVLWLSR
jgi:transposase-like protein